MQEMVRRLFNRRYMIMVAVAGIVFATAGYVVFALPESTRVLLIGKTVEHCPDSEISCPGQSVGLLHPVLAIAVILMIVFEDDE